VPNDTNGQDDIFVHDRQTGTTERVSVTSDGSQGNGSSGKTSISADRRYVVFSSSASNLVQNDTNPINDTFVHDRETSVTERVSVASDGTQLDYTSAFPSISADGRYVTFYSSPGGTNVRADVFVHDRETGATERVSVASNGSQGNDHSWYPAIINGSA
jgi:Tol biopolymer transport system component